MEKQMTLEELKTAINAFRHERKWDETDTLYILAKSVFVEAGELLECFLQGEDQVDETSLKYETADVLMYALSICYDANWDPCEIILEKLKDVAMRYPKVEQ